MNEENAGDAVRYFSDNAQQFTQLYRAQPEFYADRVRLWHQLLDRYAARGGRSIDMGCGPGVFSFYLADKGGTVVGIDGASDMVAACELQRRERGLLNITFLQARLPDVDEPELGEADLIISSSVVEYVEDLDATLALFSRLLRPGGALLISMPNITSVSRTLQRLKYKLLGTPEIYEYIRHFSSPGLLRRRVRPLGLTLVEAHYYTHFTRLAKLGRALRMPLALTEDLFVAAFRKG
ncbi:MAG TPA: methyltransferase domain-containing protein [Ktedonobacterales bacterium]|nr:methyltransferase domain-containing protein [Ktedonobacterales bacterium]